MIQRIQTVFLLIAALCAGFSYKFSFYSGNIMDKDNKPVFEKFYAHSNFILLITTAVLAAAGLSLINLLIYFMETKKFESGSYSLTSILSLAIPVVLILAARGIWKDEKLVKSVDRLR